LTAETGVKSGRWWQTLNVHVDQVPNSHKEPAPRRERKLSVTIIAKNEADRIARCIKSVRRLADDIVVVDSGSTDGTQTICEDLGARVIFNTWTGFGPQKRFSETVALHDWILNLDADEWLTPELEAEISALMASLEEIKPFWRIKILTVLPNETKPRWLSDRHNYIRLYDKRKGGFPDDLVHDEIKAPNENVGRLKGAAHHATIRSISHMASKQIDYYTLQGKQFVRPSLHFLLRMLLEFPMCFIRYYFVRRYFTAKGLGFAMAMSMASLRITRLAILYDAARQRERATRKNSIDKHQMPSSELQ
jgi:glycosyltransferase involved in cell wall biosynthesis